MASGKLAPHNSAGGRMAQKHRTMSSWKVNQGLVVRRGLMGQLGSELAIMYAVQATAKASRIWHHPRATRGRTERTSQEPTVLPIARPIRKTASMMENT
jgi:hypothetical protein